MTGAARPRPRSRSGRAATVVDYVQLYAHVAAVGHLSWSEIDALPMPRFLQLCKVPPPASPL